MKPFIYHTLLLFICALILTNTAVSQNDSLLRILPPKFEYSFMNSAGLSGPLKYDIIKGKNILEPSYGYAIDFSFNYSYRFRARWKFIMGLTVGTSGREYLFKINDDDFPEYEWVNENEYSYTTYQSHRNMYIAVPLKLAYSFLETNKHQSWLKFGGDIFFLNNNLTREDYFCTDNSGIEHNIFNIVYETNPDNSIKFRFNAGYEYHFQFKNYNQFIIGLSYSYNFSKMYSGEYEVFPEDYKYYGNGTFSSNLNTLSLEIGYSLNNKKKQMNTLNYLKKTHLRSIEIPDTMPNKSEFQIGTHMLRTSWFPIKQAQGYAKLTNNHRWTPHLGFSTSFMNYYRQNMAYYVGLDYDIGNYFFDASFDKAAYPKDIPYSITFNLYFKNIVIPIGFQYNFSLNNKSKLELGANIFTSLSSSGSVGERFSIAITDSTQSELSLVNTTIYKANYFSLGVGAKLAYTIKTKNKNKIGIGFQLNAHLTSHYNQNIELIQPDRTYQNAELKFKPTYVQAFVFYSFTWKKRRFLKQTGY